MGDPLAKEELARQLDRIGDEFARECALAASTALAELRKMSELPVDGPLTATEKLSCIREILDRYPKREGAAGRPDSFQQELEALSDAELFAGAAALTRPFVSVNP